MAKIKYSIGDPVEHKLFGKGTVLDIEMSGDNTNLTIQFKGKDSKKIVSTFIKLT